jgi:hypothetical protein
VLAVIAVVSVGSVIWGMIVDSTVRRPPSEWLGSAYLGVFAGLLLIACMLLDTIRAHVVLSCVVGALAVSTLAWLTIRLWKKLDKLDHAYYAKRSGRQHR